MTEIKDLLNNWSNDEYINRGGLESAYQAILLLVAKVEELEAQVKALSK